MTKRQNSKSKPLKYRLVHAPKAKPDRGNGCSKKAFVSREANKVAAIQERLRGVRFYVVPCFEGCGGDIYHVTKVRGAGKSRRKKNPSQAIPKKNKPTAKKRRKASLRPQICDWESEGGSYRE